MSQISCPNCEYEKGNSGRPTVRGSTIHCLECGTSWKDISANPVVLLEDNSKEKTFSEMRKMLRDADDANSWARAAQDVSSAPASTVRTPDFELISSRTTLPAFVAALSLAVCIGIGSFVTWHYSKIPNRESTLDTVSLGNIELKEQIGRTGRKVITVKGTVENGTDEYQAIRPISIILRRKDGGEIVRWRHVSHKPVLKAGAKSRFASSIQYDTPLVAYAEAVFE